jgi:hypothetical protein
MSEDLELARTTTLQAIRTAIRSRNLTKLKEAMERPWAVYEVFGGAPTAKEGATKKVFSMAIKDLGPDEKKRAFQWTWDCYHPLMGPLGAALNEQE